MRKREGEERTFVGEKREDCLPLFGLAEAVLVLQNDLVEAGFEKVVRGSTSHVERRSVAQVLFH